MCILSGRKEGDIFSGDYKKYVIFHSNPWINADFVCADTTGTTRARPSIWSQRTTQRLAVSSVQWGPMRWASALALGRFYWRTRSCLYQLLGFNPLLSSIERSLCICSLDLGEKDKRQYKDEDLPGTAAERSICYSPTVGRMKHYPSIATGSSIHLFIHPQSCLSSNLTCSFAFFNH